jgi:hypothetical protein
MRLRHPRKQPYPMLRCKLAVWSPDRPDRDDRAGFKEAACQRTRSRARICHPCEALRQPYVGAPPVTADRKRRQA